jgi:hypothetical protein
LAFEAYSQAQVPYIRHPHGPVAEPFSHARTLFRNDCCSGLRSRRQTCVTGPCRPDGSLRNGRMSIRWRGIEVRYTPSPLIVTGWMPL